MSSSMRIRVYGAVPSDEELGVEARLAANTNTPQLRAKQIASALVAHGLVDAGSCKVPPSEADVHRKVRDVLEYVHHPAYVRFVLGAWTDYDTHRVSDANGMIAHVDTSNDALVPFVFQQPSNDDELERKVSCLPLRKQLTLFASDQMTPIGATTAESVLSSATWTCAAALDLAAATTTSHDVVYCLNSSPGHHAARRQYAGYCFFNNGAVAATVLSQGGTHKVLVLDVDFHAHVSRLFDGKSKSIRMASLHHDPTDEFPYASGFVSDNSDTTFNYPLASGTTWKQHSAVLAAVLDTHVREWQPDFVVVAFGGDTYASDPDCFPESNRFKLQVDDYAAMGAQIREAFGGPVLVTQEGGYSMDAIGEIVTRFLSGLLKVSSDNSCSSFLCS